MTAIWLLCWTSVVVRLQFWTFALHVPFCILLIVFSVLFGRNCKCLLVLNVRRKQTQRNNQLVLMVLQLEMKKYCKTGGTEAGASLSCHIIFLEYRIDGNTMFLKHATFFKILCNFIKWTTQFPKVSWPIVNFSNNLMERISSLMHI